jgi:hypothetical protein
VPHDGEPVGVASQGQHTQNIGNYLYQGNNDYALMTVLPAAANNTPIFEEKEFIMVSWLCL